MGRTSVALPDHRSGGIGIRGPLLLAAAAVLLAGCGQKGALYLPDAAQPARAASAPLPAASGTPTPAPRP